jgi:hypothetical protein
VLFFAECFLVLGEGFVDCLQKALGKDLYADISFIECNTRKSLCRVPETLRKEFESGSVNFIIEQLYCEV